jgi:hypothetical protein
MKNNQLYAIVIIIIGFYFIVSLFLKQKKNETVTILGTDIYKTKIESLYNENHKLKQYTDSILQIPYPEMKETVKVKYKKEIILISEMNSLQLDSVIRSNW